jgi:SAM-dependent methyltransferase
MDFIEWHVMGQIEALLQSPSPPSGELISLKSRAEKVKSSLEQIDINLFRRLRAAIRKEGFTGAALKNMVEEYVGFEADDNDHRDDPGYDNLDIFINRLFFFEAIPQQTKDPEPEMVYYQKTPARIVLDLIEAARFSGDDVFVDIGSGMGQVAFLVHLLAGIVTKGIEFDPAFCDYARECAADLHLSHVTFTNRDARQADYSEGTVFFMFTPFKGAMLQEVLELLKRESMGRRIKIITYGPCTAEVAGQSWLESLTPGDNDLYKLAFFRSNGELI